MQFSFAQTLFLICPLSSCFFCFHPKLIVIFTGRIEPAELRLRYNLHRLAHACFKVARATKLSYYCTDGQLPTNCCTRAFPDRPTIS